MTSMSPIFKTPEPHHYSDYGFDPQINYFQVFEEARRNSKRSSIDSIHFKLSKPISKDHDRAKANKRKRWWKSALSFLKRSTGSGGDSDISGHSHLGAVTAAVTVSTPLYFTESVSGRSTPCRNSRTATGPLGAAEVGEGAVVPYVRLREVSFTGGYRISASNAPTSMPIYLVT